jgi:carbon starvation protein
MTLGHPPGRALRCRPVQLALLAFSVLAVLAVGYRLYGRLVAKHYTLDPHATTPAERFNDGVDFVPTRWFYLFGQHFSAIAAAGPIAGPILACQQFGWLPCLLWIVFGSIFIGAVHDFSTLVASLRHNARSIAEVARDHIGRPAWLLLLGFIWLALVYVIVAFTQVTAQTFSTGDAELAGLTFRFNPGGAVAASATMYLALAVIMGMATRFLKLSLLLQTLIFVPATLAVVWYGTRISTLLLLDANTWAVLILAYCFVASLLPVWSLLQPRGYLGGFVLYMALAAGVLGILFGGFEVKQPAFTGFQAAGSTGMLFPFMFVTIACGACSGFHGLVCSGTTSKQIARETHCQRIGYGAMLMEGFVATIALATLLIASREEIAGKGPGTIYGEGLGRFVTVFLGEKHLLFAVTFGAMAFSTFVFDTLDVATRLGRYMLQELLGVTSRASAAAATLVTCGVPLALVLSSGPGSYQRFWTLFGTSNQLLAGLSLLGVTVWLKRTGRRYWFVALPTVFIFGVTLTALVMQSFTYLGSGSGGGLLALLNGFLGLGLLVLALAFILMAGRRLLAPSDPLQGSSSAAS